jgi:AcrR family transcriptional regulator
MKRKKYNVRHKREKRKNEIIQAAVSLFMEKGFDRVSLSDISSKINRGRTTVYEYFSNKNEILALYLEKEMFRYHEKVMAIMGKKADFKDKLMEFIGLQLEYGSYHRGFSQLFRSLSRGSEDISVKIEKVIRGKHHEIYSALTDEFSSAIGRNEIRDMPPALMMQLLINATSLPVRSNKDQTRTAEEVFSVFWSGISNTNTQAERK